MAKYNSRVIEQGNGLPDVGDYCSGAGSLWRIVSMSRIHTGNSPGAGNYVYAEVEPADYEDCAEEDEHSALVVPDEDGDEV